MSVPTQTEPVAKRPLHAWSLPNQLTYFRILAIPLLVECFLAEGTAWHWIGFALFMMAAISDFFDGYLARLYQQHSSIGEILDPIADKVLVVVVLLLLYETGAINNYWSLRAAMIIAAREIIVSGLREHLAKAQVPLKVTRLAKVKTVAQMVAIGFLLIGSEADRLLDLSLSVLQVGHWLLWLAAAITVYTGGVYGLAVMRYLKETSE